MTNQEKAQRLQWLIAAVFFVLGGWCLVAPASVINVTVRDAYRIDHPLVLVTLGGSARKPFWLASLPPSPASRAGHS